MAPTDPPYRLSGSLQCSRVRSGYTAQREPVASELERLAGLRDQGILSADEFEAAKAKALGALGGACSKTLSAACPLDSEAYRSIKLVRYSMNTSWNWKCDP
jgi:hypothetical protein